MARNGLRARHWHVLNALHDGPLDRAQVAEAMLAFWVEASVTQTDVVDDLVRRDWVATDGSRYELTEHGHAAVSRISSALDDLAAQALRGVAPEAAAAAAEVLAALAANLEQALGSRR